MVATCVFVIVSVTLGRRDMKILMLRVICKNVVKVTLGK